MSNERTKCGRVSVFGDLRTQPLAQVVVTNAARGAVGAQVITNSPCRGFTNA
jgi:hypothetical protein